MNDHVDVLIIGAGLSGIGVAWHLQHEHPGRTYVLLEAREASGGTWDLFRYPGIRSDSDVATFAYAFKPWPGDTTLADGPEILRYLRDTAREAGIDRHIRYGHRVVRAAWSSDDACWTVEASHDGETVTLTASWLFAATGYYRYDQGYTPELPGISDFDGPVVHPQAWPSDLEVAGKRVLVIGSGATAVTLVPALAREGARVTMLQRTPSYILPLPMRDPVAERLKRRLGDARARRAIRRLNIFRQRAVYWLCRRYPAAARRVLRWITTKQLPPHIDVDEHFRPPYDPWDQRLCVVPDGDLFAELRRGRADIVTGVVDTFLAGGVRLVGGRELEADVVVTATGLNLLVFGGVEMEVDGEPVRYPDALAYRGMMLSGVPNAAFAIGYTNSSWTLKVDLVAEHLCRLLAYMDEHGHDVVVAELDDPDMETRPLLDFGAGYVRRSLHELPRAGARDPWQLVMSYYEDVRRLRRDPVADPALRFTRSRARA